MAGSSSDIEDEEFKQKRFHCKLKEKLCGIVDPRVKGYDKIIIRCGKYMSNVEIEDCKKNGFTEIWDILERQGRFGIGNYDILRQLFKGLNEPAIKVIDKYQRKIDKLTQKDEVSHKNQNVQTDEMPMQKRMSTSPYAYGSANRVAKKRRSGREDVAQTMEVPASISKSSNVEEIHSGTLKLWMEDEETFVSTKATKYIYKQAKKERKVLVCGVSGVGKSSNVHHVALKLKNEGYQIFPVQRATEMVERIHKLGENKQVYVFDDVFGVHDVVEDKRREWGNENKDNVERCLSKKPNVIILCTSRLTVIKDEKLSSLKSHFHMVNISEAEFELSDDERVEMFWKHAAAKQQDNLLTDEVKQKIKVVRCPLGIFPLVCRQFFEDNEKPTIESMEKYFRNPLEIITKMLDILRTDEPVRHLCLLMCLIYDNKLPVDVISVGNEDEQTEQLRKELLEICKLPVSTSREEIRDKMDTLLETFVKLESNTYQFVDTIIHDAIIKHINEMSSSVHKMILRHCSSTFLSHWIHLSGVERDKKRYHDTESCIYIRRDDFIYWGRRVIEILRDGVRMSDHVYHISDHLTFDNPWMDRPIDQRMYDNQWKDLFDETPCINSTDGDKAVALALANKSPSDVHSIMCAKGYSMSMRFERRTTALHWAMEHKLPHIVKQTVSMISPAQLQQVNSMDDFDLLVWMNSLPDNADIKQMIKQKLQT